MQSAPGRRDPRPMGNDEIHNVNGYDVAAEEIISEPDEQDDDDEQQ